MRLGATLGAIVDWQPRPEQPAAEVQRILDAMVRETQDLGLSLLEVPGDAVLSYGALFRPDLMRLARETLAQVGCGFTVHLPYGGLDLASADEALRQRSVAAVIDVAERLAPFEPQTYALHLTSHSLEEKVRGASRSEASGLLANASQAAARSLRTLTWAIDPTRLCVENLGSVPPEPFAAVAQAAGVRLCIDVGHLGLQRRSVLAYWLRHRAQIGEVHLHDVVRDQRGHLADHQTVGEGILPLGTFLHRIEEEGFTGPVILEVNSRADLRRSVAAIRSSHAV